MKAGGSQETVRFGGYADGSKSTTRRIVREKDEEARNDMGKNVPFLFLILFFFFFLFGKVIIF